MLMVEQVCIYVLGWSPQVNLKLVAQPLYRHKMVVL